MKKSEKESSFKQKTKRQIKLTPLFSSVVQSIVIISVILLIITIEESWSIIIVTPLAAAVSFTIAYGFIGDACYDETIYGVCRYRIIKEKILNSDLYFIQAKPLLPFFFLFWKGAVYSSFLFKIDGEECMCDNAFKTEEDAYALVQILKNRQEYKKIIFVKKIEISS